MFIKKNYKNLSDKYISLIESDSIISEQFKIVRTNIEFSSFDNEIKTIVITSVNPAAGKSTISSNLAKTFSSQEKKVLLMDADLRRPMVHNLFELNNQIGLSSLFTHQSLEIQEVIQESEYDNLSILTSGTIPPNPSEILSSKKMTSIIKECRQQFDLIIIDMPPMTVVADAQIISSKVDGTIFVLRRGIDTKEHIRKCKELVQSSNANVIGAVFNREKDNGVHYY